VRTVAVYVIVGTVVWLGFLKSGVHPTVAGVLLGLLTPTSAWFGRQTLLQTIEGIVPLLRQPPHGDAVDPEEDAARLAYAARESVSPLDRLETSLHPWVAFGIMPVFALANAGVAIEPAALADPVALAVAAGLVVGKPVGIVLFSWLAVRAGLARLPDGVDWKVLIGAGCLAGIGFTMSLFIAGLALDGTLLGAGKVGTLAGSAVSAALGSVLLLAFLGSRAPRPLKPQPARHQEALGQPEQPLHQQG
jgi:NhaA family Na+:H+ antiporter